MKIIDKNNYFAVTTRNLFITRDDGSTWDAAFLLNHTINGFEAVNKNIVFLAGNEFLLNRGFIFKSTDGGFEWKQHYFGEGELYARSINDVAVSGNSIIVCGENGAIFKSDEGGDDWVRCSAVNDELTYRHLTFSGSTGYVMGSTGKNQGYDKVIYKSSDGGSSWDSIYYFPDGSIRELLAVTSDIVYAAGQDSVYEAVYKTIDGGKTWSKVWKGLMRNSGLWSMYFVNENLGYIGGEEGSVYRTRDGGKTWNATPTGAMPSIGMLCFYNEFFGFASVGANLYKWDNTSKVPKINITPETIDFGVVEIPGSNEKTIEIANFGDLNLIISEIIFEEMSGESNYYEHEAKLPLELFPNGYIDLKLKFEPKTPGTFTGNMKIKSNDPNSEESLIPLTGKAIGTNSIFEKFIEDIQLFSTGDKLQIPDGVLQPIKFTLYDVKGNRIVYMEGYINELDISKLSKGTYIYTISNTVGTRHGFLNF